MLHGSCLSGEKGVDAIRRRRATALQRRSAVVDEKEAVAAALRQQEKALLKAQVNRVASLVGAASSTTGVSYLNHGCYLSVQILLHDLPVQLREMPISRRSFLVLQQCSFLME
ncbi:unnamed protein product [Urochloa humidicola]